MSHYDLTDQENQRWEVREPGSDRPIRDVRAFHLDEGWLEVATAAPATQDGDSFKVRRKGRVDREPTILRIIRDFDVYDLVGEQIAHQIRRKH